MPIRTLFPTHVYEGTLDDDALIAALDAECRDLAEQDRGGRVWSKEHGYAGYTSYASLDDLPRRSPTFAALVKALDRHVAAFLQQAGIDAGRRLKCDSLWVNYLKPGGAHSGHVHPHSVVSGTVYVAVPPGSGALRLEDPRLPLMMAAPQRSESFVHLEPAVGTMFLWESWLRHEVTPNRARSPRIGVSFNYS